MSTRSQSIDRPRRARAAWSWLLALFALGCGPAAQAGRDGRVFSRVHATPVAQLELTLAANASVQLQATSTRTGVVPVLHLWDIEARREVARAEGCVLAL